jgi:hypothetical protein
LRRLLDFGWSPLRALREGSGSTSPRPALSSTTSRAIPARRKNLISSEPTEASELARKIDAISPASLPASGPAPMRTRSHACRRWVHVRQPLTRVAAARSQGSPRRGARLAQITSGELRGQRLEQALRDVLREDPENPQANVRLAYCAGEGTMRGGDPAFHARDCAIACQRRMRHLGLAGCQVAARNLPAAERTLRAAETVRTGQSHRRTPISGS